MLDRGHHLVFRGAVARQLVRDHHTRHAGLPLQQLAKQTLAGLLVAPALDQNVEHNPILVDGPPEPVLRSPDHQAHFIEVPFVARTGQPAPDLVGEALAELARPLPHGLMAHVDAAGRQHLFDHAQAQRKAEGEPHGVADDLAWKAVASVGGLGGGCHAGRLPVPVLSAKPRPKLTVPVIDQYARFALPRHWGRGRAAIADGTHVKLRENNLIGSRHIRYGGYGGIAYHHIADSYIALFTSFIPCGVWEAIHILDGLMKNRSVIQPDTLHADTQGQSEPVFGLCRLLGIKLMPRMRGIGGITFYRPAAAVCYRHIDALFRAEIDWDLIATHARDVFQVVLSIQAGRVTPSVLLRKLGTYNRRSLLYRAFREIGRVERTLFLLRFIADAETRRTIRAETTKIEAFNDSLDWISFGGPVIKSGDPVEQEKQLKYASLVANAVMLSNVADMTSALSTMDGDGHPVTPALVGCLSPYTREHIRRFGQYVLDMADLPPPLDPQPLPFEKA